MLLFGIGLSFYTLSFVYKMLVYPQKGELKTAKVIGYKISSNGARMVQSNKTLSGRSPFFEFVTHDNQTIKKHSNLPQIFVFFNYELGEKVTVAYPNNEPQKAIVLSWKEIPGLLLLIGLGVLSVFVGKEFMLKQ
jgi:hypothetical protein